MATDTLSRRAADGNAARLCVCGEPPAGGCQGEAGEPAPPGVDAETWKIISDQILADRRLLGAAFCHYQRAADREAFERALNERHERRLKQQAEYRRRKRKLHLVRLRGE